MLFFVYSICHYTVRVAFLIDVTEGLPLSSSIVSCCSLFGCGALPAVAFRFWLMAQRSPPMTLIMKGRSKNTGRPPEVHEVIKKNIVRYQNFAGAVSASVPIRTSAAQELFRQLLERNLHLTSSQRRLLSPRLFKTREIPEA